MIHYFLHLPKDRQLDFETNYHVSTAIMHTARNALSPFEEYLTTSIETLKKKEDIKARWKKAAPKNRAELRINGALYEIPKQSIIEITNIGIGRYYMQGISQKILKSLLFTPLTEEKKNILLPKLISFQKISLPYHFRIQSLIKSAGQVKISHLNLHGRLYG